MESHVIESGRIVRIECELKVSGGDVIESSKKSGPVEYRHGSGQLLAALEQKLEGMKPGEEKQGTIPAKEAFGAGPTIEQKIPRASFPAETKLDAGTRFEAKLGGTAVFLEVLAVDGDDIRAKVIHPLADKDLEFSVKVLAVRPPPPPVPSVPPPPESLPGDELLEDDA